MSADKHWAEREIVLSGWVLGTITIMLGSVELNGCSVVSWFAVASLGYLIGYTVGHLRTYLKQVRGERLQGSGK